MEKSKPQGLENIAEEDWQPFEVCNEKGAALADRIVIAEEEEKKEEEFAPNVTFPV